MSFPPSNPSALFSDLCASELSFSSIAAKHETTSDMLALWLAQPEIAATLDALEAAAVRRARLSALNQLPHATKSLSFGLQGHTFDANTDPDDDKSLSANPHERRHRQNARRAAWLLYRIATLHPGAPRRTPNASAGPPSPAPRGRGVASNPLWGGDREGNSFFFSSLAHESHAPITASTADQPSPRAPSVSAGSASNSPAAPIPAITADQPALHAPSLSARPVPPRPAPGERSVAFSDEEGATFYLASLSRTDPSTDPRASPAPHQRNGTHPETVTPPPRAGPAP